jgi:hypothetical protein
MRFIPRIGSLCVGLATAGALLACDGPNTDTFRREGGASPDPTGVIEGTVLYVGPRPQCVRADDDQPGTDIIGNVILTLFAYDNPPAPSGGATSALSLLAIPGSTMFSLADCMPVVPTDEDRRPVMRSVAFTWPDIALGRGPCREPNPESPGCPGQGYQIRGFFDYDNDFNPFFSVRNLPTAGDIAGGAFISTSAVPPVFYRVPFGHIDEHPNGQVASGVAVTLGAPVSTERPIFTVNGESTRAMSSASFIPLLAGAVDRENALFDMARMRIDTIVAPTAGARPSEAWLAALDAGGIDSTHFRFGDPRYGFYISPVDANLDGMQDSHPILGTAGINYFFPIPIVRRARNPVETTLGVPDVLIVGTIKPTLTLGIPSGFVREQLMSFDAVIPPIAVMVTNPRFPVECRVPIIPPGNVAETYERIFVDCQELPTGNYDVNVLAGLAGATFFDERARCLAECTAGGTSMADCEAQCDFVVPNITDNGYNHCFTRPDGRRTCSGSFSSQAWSIPNELGCPDTRYRLGAVNQIDPEVSLQCGDDGSLMLPHQGRAGGWAIVDVNDHASEELSTSLDDGHGVAGCRMAPRAAEGGAPSPVAYRPLENPDCCPPALDRFCGLPLCPLRDASIEIPADLDRGMPGEGPARNEPYAYPEAVRAGLDGAMTRRTREMRVPGEDYRVEPNGSITPLCTPFLMPVGCCRIAELCAAGDPSCPRETTN